VSFLRSANQAFIQSGSRRGRASSLDSPLDSPTICALAFLLAIAPMFAGRSAAQVEQAKSAQNKIRGTVINAVTHQPIGRALVSSSDHRLAMLTDSEGNFEFSVPKAESRGKQIATMDGRSFIGPASDGVSMWLMARKPGFLNDADEGSRVAAKPGREVTISLMPEALIKGRVTLSTTEAATGANVQILSQKVQDGTPRWTPGPVERANANGEFRFAELSPGAYKIVTHELMDNDPITRVPDGPLFGFPPVYYPGTSDFGAAATIQLSAGQTFRADLSLVRHPYYPVTIPVMLPDTNSGMNITVSLQGSRGPGYSLGYNAAKQRIEGTLPNGNYTVEAATFGANAATGVAALTVAGAAAEGPNMVLIRNSVASLSVREEFSATDSGASASWSDGKRTFALHGPRLYLQANAEAAEDFVQRGGSLHEPHGANDDSLVLEDLAPGRYWLRLHSSRGYVASATMGGVDLFHHPFFVVSGSNAAIDITMRDDSAEVEGTVTDGTAAPTTEEPGYPEGTPSAQLYWVPLPDGPGQFLQCWAGPDGKFSSQTIAPGTYRVLAFKNRQPNLPYRDVDAMRAYETMGQTVHLSPGQKANVQIQMVSTSEAESH
jgi:hypothetical protein